ncbi:MAG: hypothetical protein H6819_06650 [Phycisphaerales bacterium]|nr:hypothetical protein [Phycisphaerales bacterium]MCB9855260.1 hypothetical protein [Phycisphaerales bacterium]MCB9862853.1 hypothetical protein [Phycisphaerales bacterium]
MADVTLDHRYPTIRIPRDQRVEPGARIALYWDGKRAPNGDGVPGDAGIDYTKPLIVSKLFSKGHRMLFGGRFCRGRFSFRHAVPDPAMGFAKGPFAGGGFAVGGGSWSWRSPFPWRDGTYALAARIRDRVGNENATAVASLSVEISALPRPVARAWVAAFGGPEDDWNVRVQWRHSPEFDATE